MYYSNTNDKTQKGTYFNGNPGIRKLEMEGGFSVVIDFKVLFGKHGDGIHIVENTSTAYLGGEILFMGL